MRLNVVENMIIMGNEIIKSFLCVVAEPQLSNHIRCGPSNQLLKLLTSNFQFTKFEDRICAKTRDKSRNLHTILVLGQLLRGPPQGFFFISPPIKAHAHI